MIKLEIAITKMSSKGQVVIPSEMRKGIEEGDKLLVIKDGDRIILKMASDLDKKLKEDLEFARRTEEAWQRIERGEGITRNAEEFLKELEKW